MKLPNNKNKYDRIIDKMIHDKAFRVEMVTKSHYWFFHYYFYEYVKFSTAEFQKKIFSLTEGDEKNIVISAFRGCGKTTIITMSYVIWSILGRQQKKHVIILGYTREQAEEKLQDIKYQFETNDRLKADLGPFKEVSGRWGAEALILPQYEAKIAIGSTEQTVRGKKYNQYRPDVFILDDIENDKTVGSQEKRDDMYRWLTRDVLPAGSQDARMILIGTPLHQDSVLIRICNEMAEPDKAKRKINGKFVRFPFYDSKGVPLWKEKFSTPELIDQEKSSKVMNDELAWQREYMLNPISEESQIMKSEWVKTYDKRPELESRNDYRYSMLSIDPAVQVKKNNDFTAAVYADIFGFNENLKIYIRREIFNRRIEFPQIIEFIEHEAKQFQDLRLPFKIVVEEIGSQGYIHQQAKDKGITIFPYHPGSKDKAERLRGITNYFSEGKVLLPKEGMPILENQMYGFGVEKHDDVVDALTMLVHTVMDFERDSNRLVVPSIMAEPLPPDIHNPEIRKSEEKKADIAQILEQEYERSNYNFMMGQFLRDYRQRNK